MTAHDKTVLLNTLTRFIEESISPQERRDITCEMCRRLTGFNIEKYLNNTHNNRKLKIKRGNSTENDNYTGVCGEITMDTDCNTIRVHDGSTLGGTTMARADSVTDMSGTDYVIAWQMPTAANNYTWYRKYKSGWVEQGGVVGCNNGKNYLSFPIKMQFTEYTTNLTAIVESSTGRIVQKVGGASNQTTLCVICNSDFSVLWEVCGPSE